MFVRPIVYTYSSEEIALRKHCLQFLRFKNQVVWELEAEKVLVYLFSNIIQVIGRWSPKGSADAVTGVLNIKMSEKDMERAKSFELTASEITGLSWEDWFIYRIDKEKKDEIHSPDHFETRSS